MAGGRSWPTRSVFVTLLVAFDTLFKHLCSWLSVHAVLGHCRRQTRLWQIRSFHISDRTIVRGAHRMLDRFAGYRLLIQAGTSVSAYWSVYLYIYLYLRATHIYRDTAKVR